MKKIWLAYAAKIDALTLRERLLVFAAALAIVVAGIFMGFVEPSQTRHKALVEQIAQQKRETAKLESELAQLTKQQADPDIAARTRGAELRRQIDDIDETLKSLRDNLVPAQRMNPLLHEMLARGSRVQLTALRTLPVAPLVPAAATPATGSGASSEPGVPAVSGVYKHGVEITLAGNYADLYDYLTRLEQLPSRMFWWRAKLNAEEHPRLTMSITIYTLSLDKAWLEV